LFLVVFPNTILEDDELEYPLLHWNLSRCDTNARMDMKMQDCPLIDFFL